MLNTPVMAQFYMWVPENNGSSWRLDFQTSPGGGNPSVGDGNTSPVITRSCSAPQEFWSQVSTTYEAALSRSMGSPTFSTAGFLESRSSPNALILQDGRPRSLALNQEAMGLPGTTPNTPMASSIGRSPKDFFQYSLAESWSRAQVFSQELNQNDFLRPGTPTSTTPSNTTTPLLSSQFLTNALSDQWSPVCLCSSPCYPASSCPNMTLLSRRPLSPTPNHPNSRGSPILVPPPSPGKGALQSPRLTSVLEVDPLPEVSDSVKMVELDESLTVAIPEERRCPHQDGGEGQCLCGARKNRCVCQINSLNI